jgi:ethanolamine ammonia-lyase small subunit
MASHRLLGLMREAWRRQLSGVELKDQAQVLPLDGDAAPAATANFLLAHSPEHN